MRTLHFDDNQRDAESAVGNSARLDGARATHARTQDSGAPCRLDGRAGITVSPQRKTASSSKGRVLCRSGPQPKHQRPNPPHSP
jgi:hypothetical protein